MSIETLHLMLNLNTDELDTQVALQCAPLLTGMKISNLLTVSSCKKDEVVALFRGTAVSCYILYESSEKTTFLLYVEDKLTAYLNEHGIREMMYGFGYSDQTLEVILGCVSGKYKSHMDDNGDFPHEIGLLLGYPAKDVTGFIENKGKNFLYIGYWKVYSDLPECKRIFGAYNHARERVIHMVSRGMKIDGILKIHNLNQYKSITI